MVLIRPGAGPGAGDPVLDSPIDPGEVVSAEPGLDAAVEAAHMVVPLVAEAEGTFKRTIKGVTFRIQIEIKNSRPGRGIALHGGTTLKGPKLIKKFEFDRASQFKLVEAFAGRLATLTTFDEEAVASAIGAAPEGFQLEVKVGEVGVRSRTSGPEIDAAILKLELKLIAFSLLEFLEDVPSLKAAVEAYESRTGLRLDIRAHGSVEWSIKPTKRMTLRLLVRLMKTPAGRRLLASIGIIARAVPAVGQVLIAIDVLEYVVVPFVLPMIADAFARKVKETFDGTWEDFLALADSSEKLLALNPLVLTELSATQHYLETLLMAHPDNQEFDADLDDEVIGMVTEIDLIAHERLTGRADLVDALRVLNRTMRHLHPDIPELVSDLVAAGVDLSPLLDDTAPAPTEEQLLSMKPFEFFLALRDAGLYQWVGDPEFDAEDRINAMLADIASGI